MVLFGTVIPNLCVDACLNLKVKNLIRKQKNSNKPDQIIIWNYMPQTNKYDICIFPNALDKHWLSSHFM